MTIPQEPQQVQRWFADVPPATELLDGPEPLEPEGLEDWLDQPPLSFQPKGDQR